MTGTFLSKGIINSISTVLNQGGWGLPKSGGGGAGMEMQRECVDRRGMYVLQQKVQIKKIKVV